MLWRKWDIHEKRINDLEIEINKLPKIYTGRQKKANMKDEEGDMKLEWESLTCVFYNWSLWTEAIFKAVLLRLCRTDVRRFSVSRSPVHPKLNEFFKKEKNKRYSILITENFKMAGKICRSPYQPKQLSQQQQWKP